MTSPRRVPSNWVLEDIGGDQIKGTNIVTKEVFSGTITQFNAMLAEGFADENPYPSSGSLTYYPDDVQIADDVVKQYTAKLATGHYLSFLRTLNGQAIVAVTADPRYDDAISYVDFVKPAKQPNAVEAELSIVGRTRIAHAGFLLGNFNDTSTNAAADVTVAKFWWHNTDGSADYVSASGSYYTLLLNAPVPDNVFIGDWVSVIDANSAGSPMPACSLQNAAIRHISTDRLRITLNFNDEAGIASQNIAATTPSAGTMRVKFFDNMLNASHGMGVRFSSSAASRNAAFTRMGGDSQISGTIVGDQRITFASSEPNIPVQMNGFAELRPSSRFRFENRVDEACFYDCGTDSSGGQLMTARAVRTSVKPNAMAELHPRFYVRVPSMTTKPVAVVSSISKSGTATTTVITAQPHGLVTNDQIVLKGVRDQTNFVNTSIPAAVTVIDTVTFTFVHGSAVTASSFGGTIHKCFGGFDQQNTIGQVAQNSQWDKTNQKLYLTGNSFWYGLNIGDPVYLGGSRSAGASTGLDGLWQVFNTSGTILTLIPMRDLAGVRISPDPVAVNVATGGTVILAFSLRIHDLSVEDWTEHRVMVDGQGSNRVDKAMPVQILGSSATLNVNMSMPYPSVTDGSGGLFIRPSIVGITDVASVALIASNTGGGISNALGNGFQVAIPVTAVSGTAPTMDVRIEESYDGGTNWVTLYEFQRITAVGNYLSPIMRASGRHIRYIRTIGGASASFTHSVVRNIMPFIQAEPQKRIVDRTINPNTANSVTPALFAGASNNQQLVVNMGAITTTAPVFIIQGSEDGVNFYDIGTPLTAVASSTVQLTVSSMSCTFTRVRVHTAGVGATLGYVSLKAWS